MTVVPFVAGPIIHRFPKRRKAYRHQIEDPQRGLIPIYGDLYFAREGHRSDTLRILLHGISSTNRSPYLAPHVHSGLESGDDVLTLALRGSLGLGGDHYHAGLTDDLHQVFGDPRLSVYRYISLIGFSMGGLTALNFLKECEDQRLSSTVALCPPVELGIVQSHLDELPQSMYRKVILSELKRAYKPLWHQSQETQAPLSADLKRVLKARTFDEWDQAVVLPRYKFASTREYRDLVSIHPSMLDQVIAPSLLIFDRGDPMVPFHKLGLDEHCRSNMCTVRVSDGGGHISFPKRLDLGYGSTLGIAGQVSAWIIQQRS